MSDHQALLFQPSFNFFPSPCRHRQDITRNLFLLLVPVWGNRWSPPAPVFLLSVSLELRILISHFPWDRTDTSVAFFPRTDSLKASTVTHTDLHALSKKIKKQGDYYWNWAIIRIDQPLKTLWISRTCLCCIMLHRLKCPEASTRLSHMMRWSLRKMGKLNDHTSDFECFRTLPTNCV